MNKHEPLRLSGRLAFCVASGVVGDGGEGFIACATTSGIVGMLHEDTTGSKWLNPMSEEKKSKIIW